MGKVKRRACLVCQGCLAIYKYVKGHSERREINYSYQCVESESEVIGLSSYRESISKILGEAVSQLTHKQ